MKTINCSKTLFLAGHECTERKKSGHLDLKSWLTGDSTRDSEWSENIWVKLTRHWKSIWLNNQYSQFDSQYRVNLTLNIESIWHSISSQFDTQYRIKLTINIESIWLSISSQFDYQYRVNLTLDIESISLKYSPITRNPGSNFSSATDSTFEVKMTPFFLSVSFQGAC